MSRQRLLDKVFTILSAGPFVVTRIGVRDSIPDAAESILEFQSRLDARNIIRRITYQNSVAREAKSASEAATWLPIR